MLTFLARLARLWHVWFFRCFLVFYFLKLVSVCFSCVSPVCLCCLWQSYNVCIVWNVRKTACMVWRSGVCGPWLMFPGNVCCGMVRCKLWWGGVLCVNYSFVIMRFNTYYCESTPTTIATCRDISLSGTRVSRYAALRLLGVILDEQVISQPTISQSMSIETWKSVQDKGLRSSLY